MPSAMACKPFANVATSPKEDRELSGNPAKDTVTVLVGPSKASFTLPRQAVYNHSLFLQRMLESKPVGRQQRPFSDWEEVDVEPDWDMVKDFEVKSSVALPDLHPDVFEIIAEYIKRGYYHYRSYESHGACGFWCPLSLFVTAKLYGRRLCTTHNINTLLNVLLHSAKLGIMDLRNAILRQVLMMSGFALVKRLGPEDGLPKSISYLQVDDNKKVTRIFKLLRVVDVRLPEDKLGGEYSIVWPVEDKNVLANDVGHVFVIGKHGVDYEF